MSKGHSLQDPFLNALRKERVPVSIYLVNGIKLQGQIESFDQFVILLRNSVSQMSTSTQYRRSCLRAMCACRASMKTMKRLILLLLLGQPGERESRTMIRKAQAA